MQKKQQNIDIIKYICSRRLQCLFYIGFKALKKFKKKNSMMHSLAAYIKKKPIQNYLLYNQRKVFHRLNCIV